MKTRSTKTVSQFTLAVGFAVLASSAQAQSRDYINMAGSSTVYPFAAVAAEEFGKTSGFKTPKIEQTGTGGGFKLFCGGVGPGYTDIANASRPIKKSEYDLCAKNGVTEIIEIPLGFDGIVIANAKTAPIYSFTRKDLFLGLAKKVPDPKDATQLIPNPYRTWQEVNTALPADKIEVLGPPATSGTRDAFLELVMEVGCGEIPEIQALKKDRLDEFKAVCQTLREDGGYIEAGENDNLIVQKLAINPKILGIFGYSFLEENKDKIQGSLVDGIAPEFETIADHQYPISRPLFMYVKKAHIPMIPGIKMFIENLIADHMAGSDGILVEKGLIPLPEAAIQKRAQQIAAQKIVENF